MDKKNHWETCQKRGHFVLSAHKSLKRSTSQKLIRKQKTICQKVQKESQIKVYIDFYILKVNSIMDYLKNEHRNEFSGKESSFFIIIFEAEREIEKLFQN